MKDLDLLLVFLFAIASGFLIPFALGKLVCCFAKEDEIQKKTQNKAMQDAETCYNRALQSENRFKEGQPAAAEENLGRLSAGHA